MILNGFTIDKYNQYNIQEKAKYSTCPLCSADRKKSTEKCMILDWERGLGTCNHCGEVIQLHTYVKKEQKKKYVKPEFVNNTELSNKVVKWFESRGISQFTLRRMKITGGLEYMPQPKKEVNTIQFNYFRNQELINIKYRDGAKNFKLFTNAEKIVYNFDYAATSNDVVIVEGEMDCLSYVEAGIFQCVSIPNGSTTGNVNLDYIDNSIEIFENKEKIYLALDNDEPGQNVQKELIRRFGSERCFLIDLKDCKDANEYLIKYGSESLKNTLKEAKEIPIDGVSSLYDWREQFEHYLLNGFKQGFKVGIKSFDNIFSTYTGQYIVVTGIPSSGKSDFVDMMCLGYNKEYGWKTAFASPENKPNPIHAGKLISKICGQWINKKEQIASDWYKKAIEIIDYNFKFIDLDGSFDLENVLSKARSLIFKFGIKVLVIDPYNKVRLKESANKNINEYTSDYLLKIDEFARKHDILIILVAHPRKPTMNEGKGYEPNFYDIKGGGEFYDMSPHGILVHRDYGFNMVKVKVLKVKFSHLGDNNKHIYLKWNATNGRYDDYRMQSENPGEVSGLMMDVKNWISNDIVEQQIIPIDEGIETPVNFYEKDDLVITDKIDF